MILNKDIVRKIRLNSTVVLGDEDGVQAVNVICCEKGQTSYEIMRAALDQGMFNDVVDSTDYPDVHIMVQELVIGRYTIYIDASAYKMSSSEETRELVDKCLHQLGAYWVIVDKEQAIRNSLTYYKNSLCSLKEALRDICRQILQDTTPHVVVKKSTFDDVSVAGWIECQRVRYCVTEDWTLHVSLK